MEVGDYVLVTQVFEDYHTGETGVIVAVMEDAPYPIIVSFGGADCYEPYKESELELVNDYLA